MALWGIDLTTEKSGRRAAQIGAVACFIAAGLHLMNVAMWVERALRYEDDRFGSVAKMLAVLALIAMLIAATAGFRLRAGKGVFWGSMTIACLTIELLCRFGPPEITAWIIPNIVLLTLVIYGVRGAWLWPARKFDAEEDAEVFR